MKRFPEGRGPTGGPNAYYIRLYDIRRDNSAQRCRSVSPVDKADLPAGTAGPILFTEAQCNFVRGKMANPEKYVCQVFTSPTETKLVYTAPGFTMPAEAPPAGIKADPSRLEGSHTGDSLGHTSVEPKAEPPKAEAPKPKKLAQRPRQEQQAMLGDVNPFGVLFNCDG